MLEETNQTVFVRSCINQNRQIEAIYDTSGQSYLSAKLPEVSAWRSWYNVDLLDTNDLLVGTAVNGSIGRRGFYRFGQLLQEFTAPAELAGYTQLICYSGSDGYWRPNSSALIGGDSEGEYWYLNKNHQYSLAFNHLPTVMTASFYISPTGEEKIYFLDAAGNVYRYQVATEKLDHIRTLDLVVDHDQQQSFWSGITSESTIIFRCGNSILAEITV